MRPINCEFEITAIAPQSGERTVMAFARYGFQAHNTTRMLSLAMPEFVFSITNCGVERRLFAIYIRGEKQERTAQ